MATFQLTQGANTFVFDLGGTVSSNGAALGNWTTNQQNQITLTANGAPVALDVNWAFNDQNQLVLSQGGNPVVNIDTSADTRPMYSTRNTVLSVTPDIGSSFSFDLRGTWALTGDHKLQFTANGATSTIDGFIQDPQGRFMYHFFNQQDQTQESILGFVGQWTKSATASGDPTLTFTYQNEDGSSGTFSLPQSIAINRATNQLMYEYDKDDQTFRVQFSGTLSITPDFQISYAIDRQDSETGEQQVAATTITLNAIYNSTDFTGDLQLKLKKDDGSTSGTNVTIAGSFTAILGKDTLQVGFSFSQVRAGGATTTTFGFNGRLQLTDIGQVQWNFQLDGQSLTVDLTGQIQLQDGLRADGRLILTSQGGMVKSVTAMFGISF